MNNIFISYAKEDAEIADNLAHEINCKVSGLFHAELAGKLRGRDRAFTNESINYLMECNIFIVIITDKSMMNQYVNQEWGYAISLMELGQIRILLHLIHKNHIREYDNMRGFISSNAEVIYIPYNESNNPDIRLMKSKIIEFLKSKEVDAKEKRQILKRFLEEIIKNVVLVNELIDKGHKVAKDPSILSYKFSVKFASEFLQVGNLFPKDMVDRTRNYMDVLQDLNDRINKVFNLAQIPGLDPSFSSEFYEILKKNKNIFSETLNMVKGYNKQNNHS